MRSHLIVLVSAASISVAGCQSSSPVAQNGEGVGATHKSTDSSASTAPNTAVLTVHGMGCPQCANNVDSQLMKVPGVQSVAIDMGSGKVTARLSPDKYPSRDQLAKAIEETGFTLVKIDMPQ